MGRLDLARTPTGMETGRTRTPTGVETACRHLHADPPGHRERG